MMSNVARAGRSFEEITKADLDALADIAEEDRAVFFAAYSDWAQLYADRVLATALCQGAALHFISGEVGIQDFDLYTFFASHPQRPWYAKRNKHVDFGDPKFGRSPDRLDFVGRRVDLMGRGIEYLPREDPVRAIQRWLASAKSRSARMLAEKAVVLLTPRSRIGEIVWPIKATSIASG